MRTRPRILLTAAAALATLVCGPVGTSSPAAAAQPRTYVPACSKLDLEVIIFIEANGAAETLTNETLGKAGLQLLDARNACLDGRVDEAVALYRGILRIEPTGVAASRSKR